MLVETLTHLLHLSRTVIAVACLLSTVMRPSRAAIAAAAAVSEPPPGYYDDINRHVFGFQLNVRHITPIIMRKTLKPAKAYDLIFCAGAPPSWDPMATAMAPGIQKMEMTLRHMRDSVPGMRDKDVAVVYLCSIPSPPGQPVVQCDSDDPRISANVARNIADLGGNLSGTHTEYMAMGQAVFNVLKKYQIPAVLVPDIDT